MAFGAKTLRNASDRQKPVATNRAAPLDNPLAKGVTTNDDRDARLNRTLQELNTASKQRREEMEQAQSHAYNLNAFVEKRMRAALETKCNSGVQTRLSEALRFYHRQFSCEELANMPCGRENALFFPLVQFMTQRMHAFLRSTLVNEKEHARFELRPTTEPDVPQHILDSVLESVERAVLLQVQQGVVVSPTQVRDLVMEMTDTVFEEAIEASRFSVKKCKRALDDRLDESEYYAETEKGLLDLVLYGTEIMYGPFPALEKAATYNESSEGELKWANHKRLQWRALDPLYFFPSVDSTNGQDGEYWCYIDYMTGHDLYLARSCDGWLAANIDQILTENEDGYSGLRTGNFEHLKALKGQIPSHNDLRFEVVWYHGYVTGRMLKEYGVVAIRGETLQDNGRYDVMVKTCAGLPICIQCPLDPKGKRPLHVAQLYDAPGAFWGTGVYDILRDSNRVANTALSSLPIDMAYAAQAMFEFDRALLAGEDDMALDAFPGMIVEKDTSDTNLSGDALKIHRVQSNAGSFMQIIREVVEHAEQLLGLPRYLTGGAQGSGALRTASGLAQLQSNAFVGIEAIIVNIDHGITKPAMSMAHRMLVQVSDDPDIIGDVEIVVLGATAMLAKQAHRDELANHLMTLFIPMAQVGLMPMEGLLDLAREVVNAVGEDGRKLIPDKQYEAAKMSEIQQFLQAAGGSVGGQPLNPQQAGGALGGSALPGAGAPPPAQLGGGAAGGAPQLSLPVAQQAA